MLAKPCITLESCDLQISDLSDIAKVFAQCTKNSDVILLSGSVGAGKTEFARLVIKAKAINENLDIENDGQSSSNEEFSSQAWVAEIGLDITDAINFAFQTVPGRDDISPLGILTFQANPNLELLGSYDSNGDWKSQVQLFFRY